MEAHLRNLSVADRIKLVEDLWDSIAADQNVLQLTDAQRDELDQRLNAYELDGNRGRPVDEVIAEIRRKL
jgi:putative addiction module component (TIGR02574 family)